MLNLLTVQDPLNDKLVTINIQVEADASRSSVRSKQRDGRTVLVSLSISGQVPVMLSGPFGKLDELIDQAWRQYGAKASTTISEVQVQPTTKQSSIPTKPKTEKNPNKESILSLF